ncbi:MAG: nucleotidyltransferase family protein, partial [Dehalococcoidia bacterium]|nr:nucleotidyltransferase family protein [Dehalococcoidia bacterium]
RWLTDPARCHLNWAVCDSTWEAEFCRVAESHPRVRAYVRNQGLGFEVPYRRGAEPHRYVPDFIVLVDDGRGDGDLLRLVVEIKGYRGEDAKEKKSAMETYWVPGVNRLGGYGRWAFAEFTDVHAMEDDFGKEVETRFDRMVESAANETAAAMSSEDVLALLREHKAALAERFGVVDLALFGSTVRGEARPDSDIDVLVTFKRPLRSKQYFGARHYLEDLLGRSVDLVTDRELRAELRPHVEAEAIHV